VQQLRFGKPVDRLVSHIAALAGASDEADEIADASALDGPMPLVLVGADAADQRVAAHALSGVVRRVVIVRTAAAKERAETTLRAPLVLTVDEVRVVVGGEIACDVTICVLNRLEGSSLIACCCTTSLAIRRSTC
jgi:hypothetical protein